MPQYLPFDGKPVSRAWHSFLTAARRAGVEFQLNSGHRTMAEQQALFTQNMIRPGVPKPGRPMTAVPNANAPHIREGRVDHAIDVNDEDLFAGIKGGADRLVRWGALHGVMLRRTVASEAWHLESTAAELKRFYRREKRRQRAARLRDLVRRLGGRRVSRKVIALVTEFEGFARTRPGNPNLAFPYLDPVGIPTIGYGETQGITMNTAPWTRRKARRRLKRRLNRDFAPTVRALKLPLTQPMFDALVSFTYNVGPGALGPGTGIGRELRARHWRKAADELLRWNKGGGQVLPGLTRRREAERAMFLSRLP